MPSCHGKYKGISFRSLLELSYLKFLEQEGLKLGVDVLYETIRIPYKIGRGKARDYIPDIYVKKWNTIIEIKHSSRVISRMNNAKFEAAREYCRERDMLFIILTEEDIIPYSLSTLAEDINIEWSPGTLRRRRFAKKIREARNK